MYSAIFFLKKQKKNKDESVFIVGIFKPSLNLILLTGPVVARVVELPLSVTVQDGGGDVDWGKAAVKLGREIKLREVRELVCHTG